MMTIYHFHILGGAQALLCVMESTKKKTEVNQAKGVFKYASL